MTGETQLARDGVRRLWVRDLAVVARFVGFLTLIVFMIALAIIGFDALNDLLSRGFSSISRPHV